jgi:pyruvate,water dikinase
VNAFVPLRDAGAACGSKAVVLRELLRAGFAVPKAFVLPVDPGVGWEHELPGVLAALGGSRFAVRSSGTVEDGHELSFAGQFHTSLGVPPARVEGAVRRTLAAVDDARAYASAAGGPAPNGVAVIVQPLLSPDAAGVAFTRDPVTGHQVTVVEAINGLGDRLVSGQAQSERWRVTPDGEARCSTPRRVLDAARAAAVGRIAVRVEQLLGAPQDVEWALADGQVWTLQARPITAPLPVAPARPYTTTTAHLAHGTPSSRGTARGRVRLIESLDDFSRFAAGEVLVCRATSPAWTPLLARAAAVVTMRGGILSHAAIIARELRIPAVTDVRSAMDLPDGTLVDVDGTAGTITAAEDG